MFKVGKQNYNMDKIINIIRSSIQVKETIIEDENMLKKIEDISTIIVNALRNNGRIYFCGNGGSAADAQHLAAELSGRFYTDRPALAAEALHANTSYLTAVANDYSFDVVYSRMIDGIATANDILIGISTSGNSKNIVKAFETATKKGIPTISLTGSSGGQLKNLSSYWLGMPSDDTPRIQESHILIGHIICQLVEEKYFSL